MEKYTPYVIDKTLKKNKFNPRLIYESLLKETSISDENAKKVTGQVVRVLVGISSSIKIITSPMIREIANSTLLEYGLETERLQYTRIGFPVYDLKCLFLKELALLSRSDVNNEITKHVRKEYKNVLDIIEKLEINSKKHGA